MLTSTSIEKLKVADKPRKYADGGGLFLFIPLSGKKLWRMAYRFERKEKLLTFGEYPHVSLQTARQCRDEAKALIKQGIDPAVHKKAAQEAVQAVTAATFREVALEWYEGQTLHCEKAYRAFLLQGMDKHFFPAFGDKAMEAVTADDIAAAVAPFQETGVLRGGRRLTDVCGQVCRYAVATGKATHDATQLLPHALRPKMTQHRAAVLDAAKLGQILCNLERHSGYFPVGCALKLIPLFFVRSAELRCAVWEEFDFSRKLWTIPPERMTTGHEHIVPLARQAVKILQELRDYSGGGALLFPGVRFPDKPIDMSTITASLRRRGYDGVKLSFDGIRSLAARLLTERGYGHEIISAQLAHHERSQYQKQGAGAFDSRQDLKARKAMMQDWADYLFALKRMTLQENKEGGSVC